MESVGGADDPPPAPPELPRFLRPLLEGLAAAGPHALDARLQRAVRREQRLDAEIGPLYRQVTASEYAWHGPWQSPATCARELLGMWPRKARALLRLERVGDLCPELHQAYRDGRISWAQGQILAPLLGRDAELPERAAWVAAAGEVSVRRLEELVRWALVVRETEPDEWARWASEPERLASWMDAGRGEEERPTCARPIGSGGGASAGAPEGAEAGWPTCARPTQLEEGWTIQLAAPAEVMRLFRAALCTVRRGIERETGRLATPGEGFEAMLDHALATWDVDDRWLRRKLGRPYRIFERDGWRCVVPGCTGRRNLQLHHVRFRSAGGGDEPENLVTLCAWHHLRGVHTGVVGISGRAPDSLRFELGRRPDGPPLARYRSRDRVA